MGRLEISNLHASIPGREILQGISLAVNSGEIHAIMGPNGSGKSTLSHVLMGKPGYEDVSGSVQLDGRELLGEPTWKRAEAGLFLAMQYPLEVVGVGLGEALESSVAVHESASELAPRILAEAERIGLRTDLIDRPLNVDLSGGERKRNETVQLAVMQPKFAVLDEIDSGLDIDALRAVARRVSEATKEWGLGVVAITHYARLLKELKPDFVHVLVDGKIVDRGGAELAAQLETGGYESYGVTEADA